jgi:pimeloyl-ACP methyl ester carboxylesterase
LFRASEAGYSASMIRHRRSQWQLWAITAAILASAAVARAQPSNDFFLRAGPYGSGVTTVTLFDPARDTPPNGSFGGASGRTLVTEVWYPAKDPAASGVRDAAVAKVPHGSPLVVHGHGLGSSRLEIRYAALHLASHGYTVASVDFPLSNAAAPGGPAIHDLPNQVGDVIFVALNVPHVAAPFAAKIDRDLVALSGYSLGGATALLAGNHPVFDAVSVFAPAYCPVVQAGVAFPPLTKPSMVMGGTEDAITLFELNMVPALQNNLPPRYLVEIAEGSHAGFLDNGSALEVFGIPKDAVICSTGVIPVGGPCQGCNLAVIEGDQLLAARQRDLAKAGLLAFVEGYIRCNPRGIVYLRQLFGRFHPEIEVIHSGSPRDTIQHCLAR